VHGGEEANTNARAAARLVAVAEFAGWALVASAGTVLVTQATRWTPTRTVAVAQALTPYLGLALVPVAAAALATGRRLMTVTAAAVGAGMLLVAIPLAFPSDSPDPRPGSTGLSIASANLLYGNERVAEVAAALGEMAPDVVVFTEYTVGHQATLLASPLADTYPFRAEGVDELSRGVAVWSRVPIEERSGPLPTTDQHIDVDVAGPDGTVRLLALHLPTPTDHFRSWRSDLDMLAARARTFDGPTVVVGDLNTTFWHPGFRRLLDAGLVDAHAANGRGFSTSWPTDRIVPAFVRLDHALTTGDLVSTAVDDFEIAGSDHRGLVVTVSPAR
jgi:endonuclease/exonuclease/phosphatase (EEP) superfamily protein YafD